MTRHPRGANFAGLPGTPEHVPPPFSRVRPPPRAPRCRAAPKSRARTFDVAPLPGNVTGFPEISENSPEIPRDFNGNSPNFTVFHKKPPSFWNLCIRVASRSREDASSCEPGRHVASVLERRSGQRSFKVWGGGGVHTQPTPPLSMKTLPKCTWGDQTAGRLEAMTSYVVWENSVWKPISQR